MSLLYWDKLPWFFLFIFFSRIYCHDVSRYKGGGYIIQVFLIHTKRRDYWLLTTTVMCHMSRL